MGGLPEDDDLVRPLGRYAPADAPAQRHARLREPPGGEFTPAPPAGHRPSADSLPGMARDRSGRRGRQRADAAPGELLDVLTGRVRVETEVRRSRFVATLVPVPDQPTADEATSAIRRELWDARHHCTALVLGEDGSRQRSHDDGEPAGTAGAPMLAVLRGAGVTDVLAVVTRYFGGVLLGTGGLARAYGQAVAAALEEAPVVRRGRFAVVEVRCPHRAAGRVEHALRGRLAADGGSVDEVAHDADGTRWIVAVPREGMTGLAEALRSEEHCVVEVGESVRPWSSGPVPR